jgi:hypothetical protein
MPFWRAEGGRKERKRRADLAAGENGLNLTFTSVMNLVIMLAVNGARPLCLSWRADKKLPVKEGDNVSS